VSNSTGNVTYYNYTCVVGHPPDNPGKQLSYNIVCFLYWQVIVSSVLSIIGSLFVIITFWIFPVTRTPLLRLVMFLSIADLMTGIFFLEGAVVPEFKTNSLCTAMAVIRTYWFITSYFWTSLIAIRLYQLSDGTYKETVGYEKIFHLLSWGGPALYMTVLIILNQTTKTDIFGKDGYNFCWFSDIQFELPFFFVPTAVFLAFNIIIYIIIIIKMRRISTSGQRSKAQTRLLILPLIFIICILPKVIGDILFVSTKEIPVVIEVIQSFLLSLQGFLDAIAYGFNPMVWREYKQLWYRLIYGNEAQLLVGESTGNSIQSIRGP